MCVSDCSLFFAFTVVLLLCEQGNALKQFYRRLYWWCIERHVYLLFLKVYLKGN